MFEILVRLWTLAVALRHDPRGTVRELTKSGLSILVSLQQDYRREWQKFRHDPSAQADFSMLLTGAIFLGLTVIVLLLMMLVAGDFADQISVDNTYSDAANNTENVTGTAFNILGTTTLVVPAVVAVGLLVGGFAFVTGRGGMGGGGLGGR